MRIWSLHPKYFDTRGLVALWREGLLAQAVLKGETKGYVHHPQLRRFREQPLPVGSIAEYLRFVYAEAMNRGYRFAVARISRSRAPAVLKVTRGQIEFEWHHLMEKLRVRDPERHAQLANVKSPKPHPLFRVVPGPVAEWEKSAALPNTPLQRTRRRRRPAER